jgi:predicted alpha/beta hydrolase
MPAPDLSRVTCPVELVSFADDVMIPPAQVRKLAAFYPQAEVSARTIAPSDVGLKEIGHIGGFARRCAPVWPLMVPDIS